ncbi:MAG: hypothetical protein L6Q71_05365 [Planctomycetes bacterium]|nr:hypothetical protein [Planctomycetota bacterium]NUQ35818.1 hypothetical protein [Planctomycetaceae bacterium]
MPHAQKLYEQYKDNPDIVILVVHTAFEKKQYPWMADEERLKKHLKEKGWTMPVARDKDEQCINKVFGLGTSSALVIDPSGVIRYHGYNGKEGEKIDKLLEEQLSVLQDVTVPAPYDVDECLSSVLGLMQDGKYTDALKQAELVAAAEEDNLKKAQKADEGAEDFSDRDPNVSAKIMRDARYLASLIRNSAKRLAKRAEKLFTYDPPAAVKLAQKVSGEFRGIDDGDALKGKAGTWADSEEYKTFVALEAEFKQAVKTYEQNPSEGALAKIEDIGELAVGTRIADEAKKYYDKHRLGKEEADPSSPPDAFIPDEGEDGERSKREKERK